MIGKYITKKIQNIPTYKIIKYHKGGTDLFLVKRRTGLLSWEYVMDHCVIGADEVIYRRYFSTEEEARMYVERQLESEKMNKVIIKTVVSV